MSLCQGGTSYFCGRSAEQLVIQMEGVKIDGKVNTGLCFKGKNWHVFSVTSVG